MRRGISDAVWASAVQWARVGVGGVVFLIAARHLPLADIGAFGMAAAPLRFLQVIHKGGFEDAAVVCSPEDRSTLAALQHLSLSAGTAAMVIALLLAPLLALAAPGAGLGLIAASLAPVSLAHGAGAVADGMLRRAGRFRALALRTFAGQLAAATLALAALASGGGIWSLVIFTLAQAVITAALAIAMAGWPGIAAPRAVLRSAMARVWPLAGRVLAGAIVQPLLQIAIGVSAGLSAAGIWQIATRIIALLEAVTLVPLRFVALPRLATAGPTETPTFLTAAALAGVWVMGGTALAAPDLMAALLGPQGAPIVPVLRILCAGAVAGSAVAVLNQSLIGTNRSPTALRIALIAALAALLAGTTALALAGHRAAEALALSQVLAGLVPVCLLLHATGTARSLLGHALRPWAGLAAMLPAVWAVHWLAPGLSPATSFAAQAIAGTAALAFALPLIAPGLRGAR
jgi:O-antigen/teichoic acid export membrane protein